MTLEHYLSVFSTLICLLTIGCQKSAPSPDTAPERRGPDVASTDDARLRDADASEPRTPGVEPLDVDLQRLDMPDVSAASLKVTIGDLTGDGAAEVVAVDPSRLRVLRLGEGVLAEVPIDRAIQVLQVARVEGEPRIVTGLGRGVHHREASARVSLFELDGDRLVEEVVTSPETERAEIVSVIPGDDELLVSWFQSKFIVETARFGRQNGAWEAEPIAVIRMATSHAFGDVDRDGADDHVIGRVYGDRGDGDAFVLRGSDRLSIPTERGVRGLALGDLDGDGVDEIYVGDGWHQEYRARAEARLSRSRWTGEEFETDLIALHEGDGEYTVWDIEVATVGADGDDALVVRTNLGAYVYLPADAGWERVDLGGPYTTLAVGDIDGEPGDEVILVGDGTHYVSLSELGKR